MDCIAHQGLAMDRRLVQGQVVGSRIDRGVEVSYLLIL